MRVRVHQARHHGDLAEIDLGGPGGGRALADRDDPAMVDRHPCVAQRWIAHRNNPGRVVMNQF